MSSPSISSNISNTINKCSPGSILTYSSFNIPKEKELALAKSLSRLAKAGRIVRMEKGKYYKPRTSVFGELRPDEKQIILILTTKSNEVIGYPTGLNVYNQLGITTQISNTITIATNQSKQPKEVFNYKVKFSKRDFKIKEADIPLLQLLDAIRDIKNISDASPDDVLKVIINKFKTLPKVKLKQLVNLALNYNPSTKAIIGALIESYSKGISVSSLYKSLNPLSKYNIKISKSLLRNQSNWYLS